MRHAKIQMDPDWQRFKAGAINKFYGTPSKNPQIFPAFGPPDSSAGSGWPEALSLLDTMQRADVQRDVVAWNAVMSACENLGECLLSMDGEVSF